MNADSHAAHPAPGASGPAHAEAHAHGIPLWLLVTTFAWLLFLTWGTFAATFFDFGGSINLVIAIAIATVKAALVCVYFMHLRYERPIIHVIFFTSLFFIALFLGAALFDRAHYEEAIEAYRLTDPDPNNATYWAPELPPQPVALPKPAGH